MTLDQAGTLEGCIALPVMILAVGVIIWKLIQLARNQA